METSDLARRKVTSSKFFQESRSVQCSERRACNPSFGYKDGISQPGVDRFTTLNPGQQGVPAGIALCRNVGDPWASFRPKWTKDGSFLVFRYFEQLVPEFDDFCKKHPIASAGAGGAELAG
jgi:deferrochelatase/peroxidase EfeB